MRLLRQASLYFREGASDKLYEIDLCSVGNDAYVVNFRYGRRGVPLKEGTKTPEPVSLYKAEEIFQGLEADKRAKGYQTLTGTSEPQTISLPTQPTLKTAFDIEQLPPGRRKAVLQRLINEVNGETSRRFPWKTSRVIWMAGAERMEEAIDLILALANKGDAMQQYAAVWALGRCGAQQAVPLFLSLFKSGTPALQRIAAAALLRVTEGAEKERQLQFHSNSLPESFQTAIVGKDESALRTLLQERVLEQRQPNYNFLEDLYLLSEWHRWMKKPLLQLWAQVPLKPNYFKHIRHILKLAEFFDDFETLALLVHRFEREEAMFAASANAGEERETFVPELTEFIVLKKELAKKSSRLAYSDRTRQYFIRRTLRSLRTYGRYENLDYVRLATVLLLSYRKEEHAAPFSTFKYVYQNRNYNHVETKFPANAASVYLNQILHGASPAHRLQWNNVWKTIEPSEQSLLKNVNPSNRPKDDSLRKGIVEKIIGFFSGKKGAAHRANPLYETVPERPADEAAVAVDQAPFLTLWNKLPQAYLQLLMEAQMDEIHFFALTHLVRHPDYDFIKSKIDATAIEQLLLSEFETPAEFAFGLATERYDADSPDLELVKAMLYGKFEKAHATAMRWVEQNKEAFLSNHSFVAAMLICPSADCRNWIDALLSNHAFSQNDGEAIATRTLANILSLGENTTESNELIRWAGESLQRHFSQPLIDANFQMVAQLLQNKNAATQMLGLGVLLLRKEKLTYGELPDDIFLSAIGSEYTPLRAKAMELLAAFSTAQLLKRQELIIQCSLATFSDVRNAVCPLIKRMAEEHRSFGVQAAEWLLPYLLRKESSEGLHVDVSAILRAELISYVKDADKALVLRLLYSAFVPTQNFGIALLQNSVDANELSLRQIIALGNHETRNVREWTWHYFEAHQARIKYEREDAIRLLDASWDDTRNFAKGFFKKHFEESDWTPEVLVALADSVRPDIEAYGRELITRFFKDEHGEEYLIKLSQHPSEKMQLFATNYLERFAANDVGRLQSLEFYFRSVLTRVNKARVAKNRLFKFLSEEGKKSEVAAQFVTGLISQISATVSVEDKAKCIEILLALQSLYDVQSPLRKVPVEERTQY